MASLACKDVGTIVGRDLDLVRGRRANIGPIAFGI
jgi:hypothetical protein